MVRYRTRQHGLTKASILGLRNLSKIGTPLKVSGYRKNVRRLFSSGWFKLTQEFTKVVGTNGTATFSGFLWGYGGEGPCGLVCLLTKLGLDQNQAEDIAFNTPRRTEVGTDWSYDFTTKTLERK